VVGFTGEDPRSGVGELQAGGAVDRTRILPGVEVEQRDRCPRHAFHGREAPGVPEVGPRLAGRRAHEGGSGVGGTVGDRGEDPSFGQREPVAGGGVLPAEPVERLAEEAKVRDRVAAMAPRP
jgi:hypothetical protein